MHGGEHEVAGQRGLHGDLGRLGVTHLAHHDLVGVVAQDGAQPAREGQPLLLVHRHLGDEADLVLDGVLDGDDLVFRRGDLAQRGVEGGGLAAARRTRDHHHAVGLGDVLAELAQVRLPEAEHVQAQVAEGGVERFLVQDADDRVLAVDGGHDGDAEVDGAALHAQAEAAVLGHALLRDVQLGHDLDAADDGLVVPLVQRLQRGVEHAVDAVLGEDLAVLGLDVDVGGAAVDGAQDQRVHQPHHRGVGGQRAQGGVDLGLVVGHELQPQRLAGLLQQDLASAVALEHVGYA